MNHGRVEKRYDLKFVTCGLESLRAIFEQKGLHILKNAMNKIRNGHDHFRPMSEQSWTNIGFLYISKIRVLLPRKIEHLIKEPQHIVLKYQQCQEELQQSAIEEGTFANDSSSTSINNNGVYYEVIRGKNKKGNVYGLARLTNKFMRSSCILTNLITMSMVQQIEEMQKKLRRSHLRTK
ncbi:hypothetical protein CR513_51628, partial [Mucuna pruriens]